MTKLSDDNVRDIKAALSEGRSTQARIGERFGVSRSVISDIATGRVHKDVEAPETENEGRFLKMSGEIEHLREERNEYRRQLKAAAKPQGLFSALVDEMEKRVKPMSALPPARPVITKSDTIQEHLVMHLSDGHHAQVVTPSDTGGLETYDFPISMCRAERYVDTILKWTQQTLAPQFSFPTLTVLASGDHTNGEIHGHTSRSYFRNSFKNSLAIGTLHSLMFRDLAPYFEQVNVVYVPGNHGRRSIKKDYHGAHDNFDYLIAKTAEMYCA